MRIITIGLSFVFFLEPLMAQEQQAPLHDDPVHNRAVELARQGKHHEGLKLLQSILDKTPKNYEVQRDFVIISRWADQCDQALGHYQSIAARPKKEAYLLVPVAECLEQKEREQQAIDLLKTGLRDWPEDEELKNTLTRMEQDKRNRLAPTLSMSFGTTRSKPSDNASASTQSNKEWYFNSRYEQRFFSDHIRSYLRYSVKRPDDPEIAADDLRRAGLGFTYRLNYEWTLDYEYSNNVDSDLDTQSNSEPGHKGLVIYKPNPLWEMSLEYASYAEDVPLRGKQQNLNSDQSRATFFYHSKDYQWTWYFSGARYDFSDSNQRKSLYTSIAYAFELSHSREQRAIVEVYRASNSSRDNVPYYNPEEELSTTLAYRADFVYDSSFERHVDYLMLSIGNYQQSQFDGDTTYNISMGQEYDLTDSQSLSFSVNYGRKTYDGGRENQYGGNMSYAYRF